MSLSSDIRKVGFEALLVTGGECLILLTGSRTIKGINAVVNRGGEATRIGKGAVDFDLRNRSTVEVLICDLDDMPAIGQTWKSEDGMFHRIQSIKSTDITYLMVCDVSAADDDE